MMLAMKNRFPTLLLFWMIFIWKEDTSKTTNILLLFSMDLKKLIKTGIPFLMISFLLIPKHLIYLFESLDLFKFVFYIYNLNNWKSNKRFNVSVPLTVILKENPCRMGWGGGRWHEFGKVSLSYLPCLDLFLNLTFR